MRRETIHITVYPFLHGSEERSAYVFHVSFHPHPRAMAAMTADELNKMLDALMSKQAEAAATAAATAMERQALINENMMKIMMTTIRESGEAASNKAATAEAAAASAPKGNPENRYPSKQSENRIDPKSFQRMGKFAGSGSVYNE